MDNPKKHKKKKIKKKFNIEPKKNAPHKLNIYYYN